MPLKPEDLKKPETVLPFLNKLETEIASLKALTAVMSHRPSSVYFPPPPGVLLPPGGLVLLTGHDNVAPAVSPEGV